MQGKKGNGKRVPVIDIPLGDPKSKHPSDRLPAWAKPLPGEDVHKYADRLGLAIHLDSMERSLRGDTAAHAKWREQAMKGLGLGQRSELDITARQEDWTRNLTDEELRSLVSLQKAAQERQSIPQIPIISEQVQAVCKPIETDVHMLGSDNVFSVKFAYHSDTVDNMAVDDQAVDGAVAEGGGGADSSSPQ